MSHKKSVLKMLAATALLTPLMVNAAKLSITPLKAPSGPYKPDDVVPFIITNNTPVSHTITKEYATGATVSGCLNVAIPAGGICELSVTINSYGTIKVRAESREGSTKGVSDEFLAAVRFASYNLSFDRDDFETLTTQMALTTEAQKTLIDKFVAGTATDDENTQARAVIQIQNVAEIIQRTSPDVVVLGEFNNDGTGVDTAAMDDFQTNYLSVAQQVGLDPVNYPNKKSVPTNTGKNSGFDLDHTDTSGELPGDAWGFGNYHGQYAFAVFSKYSFSEERSFLDFEWRNMNGEFNPLIDVCDGAIAIPEGMTCGDAWYPTAAWELFPVSSKNHLDQTVILPVAGGGEQAVHFLTSHPTPPIYDGSARQNYKRNSAEVKFWQDYIEGRDYFKDTAAVSGGLATDAYFVIAGDLNADPDIGDGDLETTNALLNHTLVNKEATTGSLKPASSGAASFLSSSLCDRNCNRANGNTITSNSGLRLDHVIPSANLEVVRSGVFWPAPGEPGYDTVHDASLGTSKSDVTGKGVSSDHRLVWVDLYVPAQ